VHSTHHMIRRAEPRAHHLSGSLHLQSQGVDLSPQKLTLGAYLQWWLKDCIRPRARASTFESYEGLIERHVIPSLGDVQLQQLTAMHIQSFLNDREQAGNATRPGGLSPRTRQYLHGVLKSAIDQAVRQDLVQKNVVKLVRAPRVPHFEVKPLSPAEAIQLLRVAEKDRLGALCGRSGARTPERRNSWSSLDRCGFRPRGTNSPTHVAIYWRRIQVAGTKNCTV